MFIEKCCIFLLPVAGDRIHQLLASVFQGFHKATNIFYVKSFAGIRGPSYYLRWLSSWSNATKFLMSVVFCSPRKCVRLVVNDLMALFRFLPLILRCSISSLCVITVTWCCFTRLASPRSSGPSARIGRLQINYAGVT